MVVASTLLFAMPGPAPLCRWGIAEYEPAKYPCWPDGASHGVATIVGQARACPKMFEVFDAETMRKELRDVYDLPQDTNVFCLPRECDDYGCVHVLTVLGDDVVQCWLHPCCVKPVGLTDSLWLTVGLTGCRRDQGATHRDLDKCKPGVYNVGGDFVLVALWKDQPCTYRHCTGHCARVAQECLKSSSRLSDILDFASRCANGWVVCRHGKHRSVSAAYVLHFFGNYKVDWTKAAWRECLCESSVSAGDLMRIALSRNKPPDEFALWYGLEKRLHRV